MLTALPGQLGVMHPTAHQRSRAGGLLSTVGRQAWSWVYSKALKGVPGALRVRAGDYRVVYRVEDRELLVLVVAIGHRREVYRSP